MVMKCSFFYKKGLLSTHQSAIREAPTIFSRLPSLMAADKPCPLLQPSLPWDEFFHQSKKHFPLLEDWLEVLDWEWLRQIFQNICEFVG